MELCRDLDLDGLTPSATTTAAVVGAVSVPVVTMIRPRHDAGFRVSATDAAAMLKDLEAARRSGARGVVLGVLDHRGAVDAALLVELVEAAGLPVTFHKAFDQTPDPMAALAQLMDAGVARILTSGAAPTAWEGRDILRALVEEAGERLSVVGAGRVRADHAVALVHDTGLREVHARAEAVPELIDALSAARGG